MRRSAWSVALAAVAFALVASIAPAAPQEAETRADSAPSSRPATESRPEAAVCEAPCAKSERYWISGLVSVSYRGRLGDGDHDEDLYGYVVLDGGRSEVDDAIFHLMGRVTYDLDGDVPGSDPFYSLNDLDGGPFDFHVYEAFAELRRSLAPDGIRRVRVGRQNVYSPYSYLLDGVRVDFEPLKSCGDVQVALLGGIPAYLYDESWSGKWLAGTEVSVKPWRDGRVDLRYTHIEEDAPWIEDGQDDYASIALRQRLTEDFGFYAIWNTVDFATRDASIRFDWLDPRTELSIHASYRYQATITNEYTSPYDPYVAVLGPSYAYHQIQVEASKQLSDRFAVDAGVTGQFLVDSDDESEFNHQFVRGWLSLSSTKWPSEDLDLSVTGELWHATDGDTGSFGAEATWRPCDRLRVGLGSYYSLYKQDWFTVSENEDVTTLFLKLQWKFRPQWRLDARYEFETGDAGDFHSILVGTTWNF